MKVIVTGSFNPITRGHEDIIRRASRFFSEVIVAVFNNAEKEYEFSLSEREELCRAALSGVKNARVVSSDGMVVDLCRKENCFLLLRGIRNPDDLSYEKMMADNNRRFEPRCDTFFMTAAGDYGRLSSSVVRDMIRNNEDFSEFVPETAMETLKKILKEKRGLGG